MVNSGAASAVRSELRKKLISAALGTPEFKAELSDAAAEIRASATPRSTEATIEGCFERVLYALLREIGVRLDIKKESAVESTRHLARGRTDSRIGSVVIEYKRPSLLKTPRQVETALEQLEGYLAGVSNDDAPQHVGILTNGLKIVEVRARRGVPMARIGPVALTPNSLERVTHLLVALDQTALTAANLIKDFCGSETDGVLFDTARALYGVLARGDMPQKTRMLQSEWEVMFRLSHDDLSQQRRIEQRRTALGEIFGLDEVDTETEYRTLFALQTAYAIVLKLIAFRVVSDVCLGKVETDFRELASIPSQSMRGFCARLEDGEIFRDLGIVNLLEGDFFSWYADRKQWTSEIFACVRKVVEILQRYEDAPRVFAQERAPDLFRELYEAAMPRAVRSSLGEFYTPFWLAEHVLDSALSGYDWRALDPCCGSGTFVVAAIKRLVTESVGKTPARLLDDILYRVAAIDINPISVLMTRVHYFIHISQLLLIAGFLKRRRRLVIPVFLGDAGTIPERTKIAGVDCLRYELRTLQSPIDCKLPISLLQDTSTFIMQMVSFEHSIKAGDQEGAAALLIDSLPRTERVPEVVEEIRILSEQLAGLEAKGWNGIWARILANFLTTACLGNFTAIAGNPPWIDWKNLPTGYRERIKGACIDRGLFSGAGRTGGINLNICALIAYTSLTNWLSDDGRLAFLMPRELIRQASYEGWRRLGEQGWRFTAFWDWTKAGHPFDPIKEDFLTVVIARTNDRQKAVPLIELSKRRDDRTRAAGWPSAAEALDDHLVRKDRVAGQIIPGSTAFTVSDSVGELKQFALIAGDCEYIGREGVEFYPQELLLFQYVGEGSTPDTVFLRNIQVPRSKYRHPRRRLLLETRYLFPLVKGPEVDHFAHDYSGLIVAFPYEETEPMRPIPREELRFTSPRLFRYFMEAREALESQTKFSDKIRGDDPGEFYGLARTGPYSFADVYVAFRDNTHWCATVVSKASLSWGEKRRVVFQNHAVSMCERSDRSFITKDEAHFVCAILNAPIVERFIYASSDERSYKIRPPVFVPRYEAKNARHRQLVDLSKLAHSDPDELPRIRERIDVVYLELCRERPADETKEVAVPQQEQEDDGREMFGRFAQLTRQLVQVPKEELRQETVPRRSTTKREGKRN